MFTISCPPKVIWLGRKGENEFRAIEVEVSEWLRDYPNGTVSVVYHRPDGAIYLPAVTTNGNVTSWLITATDTAIAGKGEVEYRLADGDIIGKSVKMPTMVSAAINATTDSPAPPPEDWTAVAAEILGMIGNLDNLDTEAKNNLVAAINEAFNSGGGTTDHRQLTHRNDADQHPMSAITGLVAALNGKQPIGDYATSGELDALADIVDGKADAADIPSLDGYATETWVESKGYLTQHQSLAGYATESYVQNYHDGTKQDKLIAGQNITIAADGKTISATGGGGGSADAVLYTPQSLTDAQKAQARENIGAEETLDSITTVEAQQTEIDLSDIPLNTAARHGHSNKSVLDGITAEHIAYWNTFGIGVISDAQPSAFHNKSALYFGDSITDIATAGYTQGYYSWVKVILGMSGFVNLAHAGDSLAQIYAKINSASQTADLVCVMGGVNQLTQNVPLGQMGDTDLTTTYGCIYNICTLLNSKFPSARKVFITPHEQTRFVHSGGVTTYDVAKAIKETCEKYKIVVYDNYVRSEITADNINTWTVDGCHWNDAAHEMTGKNLAKFLNDTFRYV